MRTTTPPPPRTTPPPAGPRNTWWIVPAVIVGLILILWLVLAGMPFGRREAAAPATATTETIAEGTATTAPPSPAETSTIVDDSATMPPLVTNETAGTDTIGRMPPAMPPVSATTPPLVNPTPTTPARTVPAPTPRPTPVPRSTPPPVTTRPASPPPTATTAPAPRETTPPSEEITEQQATARLRGYLASHDFYDVGPDCLSISSLGYRNAGYTFAVFDRCVSGGGSRMLGRWRVDAKTSEVFRQQDDGRYQRP